VVVGVARIEFATSALSAQNSRIPANRHEPKWLVTSYARILTDRHERLRARNKREAGGR
jgi:hypothetical protein